MTTAKSNKSERTFTIRKNGSKYRTNKMSKDEFNRCLNNTSNDWNDFLRYSGDYYVIN